MTYDNYQVTGFVVSEPYESESVSFGLKIPLRYRAIHSPKS